MPEYVRIHNPNDNTFYQMLRTDVSQGVVDMGARVSDEPWPGIPLKKVNHEHKRFREMEVTQDAGQL